MKTIAVLGPKGTFSDVACQKFFDHLEKKLNIQYYSSIEKTAMALETEDYAILPFENSLDGYVMESLDALMNKDIKVIAEISCPIHFDFISFEKELKDIKSVFVQYKAKPQCSEFLHKGNWETLITQSNIESLKKLQLDSVGNAAIIPSHTVVENHGMLIKDVADNKNNVTRFFVVGKPNDTNFVAKEIKVSLCVYALKDKPGILYRILSCFDRHQINLSGILSRPTKKELGNYNFYIEFNVADIHLAKLDLILKEFEGERDFKIKVIGIYSNIGVK